jgi:hypothetical protein
VLPLLLLFSFTAAAAVPGWQELSRNLGAEKSAVRQESAKKLAKISGLEKTLAAALTTEERPLAIKAIRGLGLQSLVPQLLETAKQDSSDWRLIVALNDFAPKAKNKSDFTSLYKKIAEDDGAETTSRVAALDGIGLLKENLPKDSLRHLLASDIFELQLSALDLAGSGWADGQADYAPLLEKALDSDPYQLRLKALEWIATAPAARQAGFRSQIESLTKDRHAPVRELALELKGRNK